MIGALAGGSSAATQMGGVTVSAPAVASAAASPLMGGILGGALDFAGAWYGNRSAAKEADKNRQWQERMRSTQYQTAVADLKAAGLNPMLAYTQGGAGTPGGSTASQQGVHVGASAKEGALAAGQMGVQKMQEESLRAGAAQSWSQVQATHAQAALADAQTAKTLHDANISATQAARDAATLKDDIRLRGAQADTQGAEADKQKFLKALYGSPLAKEFLQLISSALSSKSIGAGADRAMRDLLPVTGNRGSTANSGGGGW